MSGHVPHGPPPGRPPPRSGPAIAAGVASLFFYGDLPVDSPWLSGGTRRPAWTRGSVWRGARPGPVLVPDAEGRVNGVLVELDEARVAVLDLLLAGPGVRRAPLTVAVGLRPLPAQAWIVPDARVARREGYRRPGGPR